MEMVSGREKSWSGSLLFLLMQQLLILNDGLAQDCLRAADSDRRQIPFRDDNGSPRLPSGTQAIITSYKFHCCGFIHEWQTYVQPGGTNHRNGVYDITFQVWRPSPTVNSDGCYGLVGENVFTRITLGDGGLVSETPEPTNRITVQPGDVVGYFTFSRRNQNEGIQLDTSFSDEVVWYHTSTDPIMGRGDPAVCPFPVGSQSDRILRSSTNAGPVFSVGVSFSSCPPTPMSPTPRPSPVPPITPPPTASSSSLSAPIATPDSPTLHPPLVLPAPTPTHTFTDSSINHGLITDQSTMSITVVSSRPRDATGVIVGVIVVVILLITIAVISVVIVLKRKSMMKGLHQLYNNVTEFFNPYNDHASSAPRMKKNEEKTRSKVVTQMHPGVTTTSPPSAINPRSYAFIDNTSSSVEGSSSEPFIQLTVNEAYTTAIVLNDNLAYGAKKRHQINDAVNLPVKIDLETGSSQDEQSDEMTYDYIY